MIRCCVPIVALLAFAGAASAQVNGTIAGDSYGAPFAVQTTQTGFGDNFSEMNALYARIDSGRLFVTVTGNIEANFNKMEFFLDSRGGGQNVFPALPGNDGSGVMAPGLRFPLGYSADYHLIIRRGTDNNVGKFDVDFADLNAGTSSSYSNLFAGNLTGVGSTGTGVNASPMQFGYDNSNVAGVIGGSGAADQTAAAAVQTGVEFSIALSDLGVFGAGLVTPVQEICMIAFQNNQGHNYASNQFLPGLVTPQGNWGGDGTGAFTGVLNLDMQSALFEGYRPACITIPAPASLSLLGLGGLIAARRRRA
jgi:hypothetical protein